MGLPDAAALASYLGPELGAMLAPYVERALVAPAALTVARPSKRIRAQLLQIGATLAGGAPKRTLEICACAIELLHAGSLIIDDIQDGSQLRRGAASLHVTHGIPRALCSGNWLYFRPLSLIRSLGLPAERELRAYHLYHDALERAHFGQALDLTVRIDDIPPSRVAPLCDAVLALKTGAVTALALSLGALVAGASDEQIAALAAFGEHFGTVLQRCDDLGNILGRVSPDKQFEDLLQRKPTGFWGYAATALSEESYESLRTRARRLPDDTEGFIVWLGTHELIEPAFRAAEAELDIAEVTLATAWRLAPDAPGRAALRDLGKMLIHAYR